MSGPSPAIAASEAIIDILLKLSPDERVEAIQTVHANDVFCPTCGLGEPDHPNKYCQCWNDE